ncbi:unnamed protein product [Rotaria socialis]|uniref:Spermatogenesis-associated protein 7 n=1 Tax=Rotaria socialis TaxID=392032 RepID=A0A818PYB7_9BILA|nr:unnamed protein product [Rotaria socialis]
MSSSDLLSSTLKWPGKGLYGLKSSVLQTTENNLVKQTIVSDHMRNHYRLLGNAKPGIDAKPPKAMVLGQKCRDRARKEMAQLTYTQNVLNQFAAETNRDTPRSRASHSARSRRIVQSQPTTYRARSRSIQSGPMMTRSLNMNGSTQSLNQATFSNNDMANKLFGDGVLNQALTAMSALGKMTSTTRNKSSADVLDKHPDSFSQPHPTAHKPRLVKRDGTSSLINNRSYYNPPRKAKPPSAKQPDVQPTVVDENKKKEDEQAALREQLNKSFELRQNVEKKIKKAKATTMATPVARKQSDEVLKRFGLTEDERLQYVRFMQELTDTIIQKNLTTESAIEKLFEIHIDRNRGQLNEKRLRDLLEALKDDLGVQTSRQSNTYSTVQKAATYDSEPIPPQTPVTTRKESLVFTPKTPHDERRRSSFDVNEPLPWESNNDIDKPPTITKRITQESHANTFNNNNNNKQNSFNDDYLFAPSSTPVKPKPRSSLLTNNDDHHHHHQLPDITNALATESESESAIPVNLNATVRKPITDLKNIDWLTDPEPTKTIIQKSPLHEVDQHHFEEEDDPVDHSQHKRSSVELNDHPEHATYGSNDFDDDDNSQV